MFSFACFALFKPLRFSSFRRKSLSLAPTSCGATHSAGRFPQRPRLRADPPPITVCLTSRIAAARASRPAEPDRPGLSRHLKVSLRIRREGHDPVWPQCDSLIPHEILPSHSADKLLALNANQLVRQHVSAHARPLHVVTRGVKCIPR